MVIKKLCQLGSSLFFLFYASLSCADNPFGQTLQIRTHFNEIMGKPIWLLEIRDLASGQVSPYIFDIKNNDNFWVAFSYGHTYQVTASSVKFGPYAVINNFCGLENGILSGKSMFIVLSGQLTPSSKTYRCDKRNYNDTHFTIVEPINE